MARLAGLAAGMVALVASAGARAEPMDPAMERMVIDPRCHNGLQGYGSYNDSDPSYGSWFARPDACAPDNASFKKLINQWGFVLAPSAMHSARTTGYGGFHLSLEAVYTDITEGSLYWRQGTQGRKDPSTGNPTTMGKPGSALQVYSAKLRKSFGFGLELTSAVGFVPESSIITGGADVRLSLLEGFRRGILGVFPDIAAGAGVRTITGTPQFQLTVVGADGQISKPLPIADSQVITPWIGYQYLWIFGDSGLIDLTPRTDAIQYCQYGGQNVPGNADPDKPDEFDGQPVCLGGSPLDFNNNVVFRQARLERQRMMFGLNYRYEMVSLGLQFITDIVDPADAQTGDETIIVYDKVTGDSTSQGDKEILKDEDRQWSMVVELGAQF